MMLQKILASKVKKVGKDRVKIVNKEEVEKVITREDVRKLIHKGAIKILPKKGTSRGRARVLHEKKKKGKRRGKGSRKGKKGARTNRKRVWINLIRKQRKFLRYLKENNILDNKTYRDLYLKAKGGAFRSLAHLKLYLEKIIGEKKWQ